MVYSISAKHGRQITLLAIYAHGAYFNYPRIFILIVKHDNYLCNEVTVLDVYITKAHQGKNCIDILINDMIPSAFSVGALRIKWDSRTFDTEFWMKRSYGNKIESYKVFYVEINDDSKKKYKKNRRKTE